jgi:hypothetical protein
MSQNLHVIPVNLAVGQKFDKGSNTLTLKEAGAFFVTIREYAAELKTIKEQLVEKGNNRGFQKMFNKSLKPGTPAYIDYKKKEALADQEIATLEKSKENLVAKYTNVKWCWQLFGTGAQDPTKITHNEGFAEGISDFVIPKDGSTPYRQFNLSKLLEGGGYAWLEVFTKDDIATGKPPHGFFVRATGVPKILRTEWTDFDLKPITETVGFTSKALLNIYTEGLYGQELDIELIDHDRADLNDSLQQRIIAEVNTYKLHANESGKTGIGGNLKNATKSEKVSEQRIQKAVIEVFVNQVWRDNAGKHLSIFPKITQEQTREVFDIKDMKYLDVKDEGRVIKDPADSGNRPLMVGQVDTETQTTNEKTKIDFTFGVFIDGTLNNMYDSIARKSWEADQIKNKNGDTLNPKNNLIVAATSQEDINKGTTENANRYKYEDDSSYENDLSNPAIIYQNYDVKGQTRKYKIYSEGMGTNTLAQTGDDKGDGLLPASRYEENDVAGYVAGQGKSGIIDRVKRAIELMVEKIVILDDEKIGTLTIDVFGFSRGAASARNFVHEITLPSASASKSLRVRTNAFGGPTAVELPMVDHNDYEVGEEYADKMLPPNGRLGWLLAKKGLKVGNLVIRFAGLYDSVPHHGILQGNDIKDLGLNSISKSNYTVHLVAGDEHRKNFSLVDISCITGQKGGGITSKGIELYMPGVHCDVGGSYVEGRGENNGRLLVSRMTDHHDLTEERNHLMEQGWFLDHQIGTNIDSIGRIVLQQSVAKVLWSKRQQISNQYSFIPLHIMAEFCTEKGLPIDSDLYKKFKFADSKYSDANFLETIKKRLKEYANGGKRFIYEHQTVPQRTIVSASDDYNAVFREEERRKKEEIELNNEHNKDIKRLRNQYLHWNAAFGEGKHGAIDTIKQVLAQANEPNLVGKERKREIRN